MAAGTEEFGVCLVSITREHEREYKRTTGTVEKVLSNGKTTAIRGIYEIPVIPSISKGTEFESPLGTNGNLEFSRLTSTSPLKTLQRENVS
jgi:hypothetical protein